MIGFKEKKKKEDEDIKWEEKNRASIQAFKNFRDIGQKFYYLGVEMI